MSLSHKGVALTSGWPRAHHLVRPLLYFRSVPFHIVLSGFSKLSEGRPPSLFSPPNFVVHRVDCQRAVARRTRGGNRNWTPGSGHNHPLISLRRLRPPLPPPSPPPPCSFDRALARTHTRVALCPVSRTQLGWVSAFNPLGGAPSLSRKACIHLRPRKAVGFVSGWNGPRTDGRMDWTDSSWLPVRPTYSIYNLQLFSPVSSSSTSWTSLLTSLEPLALRQTFR